MQANRHEPIAHTQACRLTASLMAAVLLHVKATTYVVDNDFNPLTSNFMATVGNINSLFFKI